MKTKLLPVSLAVFVLVAGCSRNEIEIRNIARGSVIFLFRGQQDSIPPGRNVTLGQDDPIPNGTFHYSTTYEVPPGYGSSTADEQCAGTLDFIRNQTRHVLIYSYTESIDSAGRTYQLHCNRSSNDPIGGP